MNCVPTAVTSDVDDPASPHTSSLTPSATPAATAPATAPDQRAQSHAPSVSYGRSRDGAASRFHTMTRRRK